MLSLKQLRDLWVQIPLFHSNSVMCIWTNVSIANDYIMHMNDWISLLDTMLNELLWFQLYIFLVAFQNKLLTWSFLRDNITSLKPCIVYVTIKPQFRRSTLWAPSKYLKLQGLSHKSTLRRCITMPLQANAHLKTKPRNTHKPCHQKYKYITTKHTNIKPGDTQIQNQEPHKYIEAKLRWYIGVWEAVQGNTCGQLHLLACPTRQTLQQPPSTNMKRQCSQIQIQTDIQIQLIS